MSGRAPDPRQRADPARPAPGGGPPFRSGEEVRLEHLTWPEVAEARAAGFRTVVFSCGAVEQHGPAIALSMDAEHGSALALAVARRLGRALVAPTVRVGCSEHHMTFPGTLSLERDTFHAVLRDYVRSLARHGFRRIVILPTHGGNFEPLAEAVDELNRVARAAYHPPGPDGPTSAPRVQAFTDLFAVMEVWTEVCAQEGMGERVGGHADVAEGSIMMALHPDRVRADRVEPGRVGPLEPDVTRRLFNEGMAAVSANGILGDPTGMNAALGRRLIEALAERTVSALEGAAR